MPEHLRALVVVLALATAVFGLARAPLRAAGVAAQDYDRRCILWYVVTLGTFLSQDFWVGAGIAAVAVLAAARSEKNPVALFFVLLFAVPMVAQDVPGLGMFQYLFELDHARLLSLALLAPAALRLRAGGRVQPLGAHAADRFVLAYLALRFTLHLLSVDSFTNVVRWSVFYAALDVFLPYYVASRAVASRGQAVEALAALALSGAVLAALAAFEAAKHWLLYAALSGLLAPGWGYGQYLGRGDSLRALVTTGQPLALGFVLVAALGAMLAVRPVAKHGTDIGGPVAVPDRPAAAAWMQATGWLLAALIAAGIVASLSRGPWLGAAALAVAFAGLSRGAARRLGALLLAGALAAAALAASPLGERIVDYLPFVGRIDEENVTYRSQLIESSLALIQAHPFFGNLDFTAGLENMRQGQGIIDIVNTWLGVTLSSGLAGLALFAGAWLAPLAAILSVVSADAQAARLRAGLGATLLASMLIIFTTSSITVIPFVYWTLLGLAVAVARIERDANRRELVPSQAGLRSLA